MTRPDYCPLCNEPCQSLCDEPCSRTRKKMKNAPTLEDFCEVANALYEAPTEQRFYDVVNLAREALLLSSKKWDEGYQFALSQYEQQPYAWTSLGACTGLPVFSTTAPDEPNVAGWTPLYRRIAHNA